MVEKDVLGYIKRYSLYAGVSLIVLTVFIYLLTDYKFVDSVQITGNYYITDEDVINLSGLQGDQLYLAIDEHKIEEILETNPIIESAFMTKEFPNDIKININEHKALGCLEEDDLLLQLFSNGYLVEQETLSSCEGSIITGVNAYFSEHLLADFVANFKEVDPITLSQISETIYSPNEFNEKRLVSYMSDGNKVVYSIDTIGKLNYYSDMVHQIRLEYNEDVSGTFDLEIGAYFTPY